MGQQGDTHCVQMHLTQGADLVRTAQRRLSLGISDFSSDAEGRVGVSWTTKGSETRGAVGAEGTA